MCRVPEATPIFDATMTPRTKWAVGIARQGEKLYEFPTLVVDKAAGQPVESSVPAVSPVVLFKPRRSSELRVSASDGMSSRDRKHSA